jgi:hypothetical protein
VVEIGRVVGGFGKQCLAERGEFGLLWRENREVEYTDKVHGESNGNMNPLSSRHFTCLASGTRQWSSVRRP